MVLAPPKIYKQQDFDTASAADMDIKTGCETKKKCREYNEDGTITLKKTHNYYFQVQRQRNITKRDYCIFALPLDLKYTRIERDEIFWQTCMIEKLIAFFNDHMVPEIIDPRFSRGMPLRN